MDLSSREDSMSKAVLKVSEGGKFAVTEEAEPTCKICQRLLRNKDWVYFCEISKELFCEKCMKQVICEKPVSKNHYLCSGLRLEHNDWYCILQIKK